MRDAAVSRPGWAKAWRRGRALVAGLAAVCGGAALPAWAQPAGSPPRRSEPSEEACQGLRRRILTAWYRGAYVSTRNPTPELLQEYEKSNVHLGLPPQDPEEAAAFPALWEDYVTRCRCRLDTRWYLTELVPEHFAALYEEALARCRGSLPLWRVSLAAAAAVGAGVALASGGGEDPGPAPVPGAAAPPPPAFGPASGTFHCSTQVTGGDRRHVPFISLAEVLDAAFRFEGQTLSVSAPPGSNFVPVTGPFDASARRARLTGSGTVAGRPDIGVAFEVQFADENTATGDYVMGIGGGLPDGTTTTYGMSCRR